MIYIVCSQENHLATLAEQRDMSRKLLQMGLFTENGIDLASCEIVRNTWGKPLIKSHQDVHYSISHCTNGVALSLSTSKTGIDIERIRPFSMTTAKRVLTDTELLAVINSRSPERAFFRFWTLKESYTKALGTGLSYPMNKIDLAVGQDLSVTSNKKNSTFYLYEKNLDFIAAVCYLGSDEHLKEPMVYRLLL